MGGAASISPDPNEMEMFNICEGMESEMDIEVLILWLTVKNMNPDTRGKFITIFYNGTILPLIRAAEESTKRRQEKIEKNAELLIKIIKPEFDVVDHEKKENFLKLKATQSILSNKELMLVVVAKNGLALEYASEALKADKEVVLAAVAQDGDALEYASDALKTDKEVVLRAKGFDNTDREAVLEAVAKDWKVLRFAPPELQADEELLEIAKPACLAAVTQDGDALKYATPAIRADKEVVTAAVTQQMAAAADLPPPRRPGSAG